MPRTIRRQIIVDRDTTVTQLLAPLQEFKAVCAEHPEPVLKPLALEAALRISSGIIVASSLRGTFEATKRQQDRSLARLAAKERVSLRQYATVKDRALDEILAEREFTAAQDKAILDAVSDKLEPKAREVVDKAVAAVRALDQGLRRRRVELQSPSSSPFTSESELEVEAQRLEVRSWPLARVRQHLDDLIATRGTDDAQVRKFEFFARDAIAHWQRYSAAEHAMRNSKRRRYSAVQDDEACIRAMTHTLDALQETRASQGFQWYEAVAIPFLQLAFRTVFGQSIATMSRSEFARRFLAPGSAIPDPWEIEHKWCLRFCDDEKLEKLTKGFKFNDPTAPAKPRRTVRKTTTAPAPEPGRARAPQPPAPAPKGRKDAILSSDTRPNGQSTGE